MGSRADLSGNSNSTRVRVSRVIEKAFIEVDEEGTTAAAATALIGSFKSKPARPIPFVADHPFLFYLWDTESGMLLFQGRVLNPLDH